MRKRAHQGGRAGRKHWGKAVSKILPGDHIHDVAPSSRANAGFDIALSVVELAQAKRDRKRAKRLGLPDPPPLVPVPGPSVKLTTPSDVFQAELKRQIPPTPLERAIAGTPSPVTHGTIAHRHRLGPAGILAIAAAIAASSSER